MLHLLLHPCWVIYNRLPRMSALLAFPLILTHKESTLSLPALSSTTLMRSLTQSHLTASPSLPIPSEELIAISCSTSAVRVILLCFTDGNYFIAFLLHNSFYSLLFVAHAVHTGVDALQLRYWSHPQIQHAASRLISSKPGNWPCSCSHSPGCCWPSLQIGYATGSFSACCQKQLCFFSAELLNSHTQSFASVLHGFCKVLVSPFLSLSGIPE